MKTLPSEKSDHYFQKFWDKCLKEFIKIETLQDYSGEDSAGRCKLGSMVTSRLVLSI